MAKSEAALMCGSVSRVVSEAVVLTSIFLGACSGSTGSGGPSPSAASQGRSDINNQLWSVTCASTSHCLAVGVSGGMPSDVGARTLIEENTGGGWTIVPSSTPTVGSGVGSLLSVTCANTAHCIAVGSSSIATTLIEENTGSGWAVVPSPNPIAYGRGAGRLAGVTCASATHCIAVGQYQADNGHSQTLIEENTGGGWTIVPSPNSSRSADNSLRKVACTIAGRCIAVGSQGVYPSNSRTLIEENTGRGWTIVPSPNNSDGYDTDLNSVACAGADRCIAVGSSRPPALFAALPFILENAKSGWSMTLSPIFNGVLSDVSCASSTNCIAVGSLFTGQTVIEQKTGNAWILLPRLTLSTSDINGLNLYGVACAGADHCFIVGDQFIGYGSVRKTLIVENTGSGWLLVGSPNP